MKDIAVKEILEGRVIGLLDIIIITATLVALIKTRIPSPYIVMGCLGLGVLSTYL